jgi:hypothetical protein
MNTDRLLHSVNLVLWMIQLCMWLVYAHSTFMAVTSAAGAALSWYLAKYQAEPI